jgi:DNA invertase Pin-like site-specific DNA recombinase
MEEFGDFLNWKKKKAAIYTRVSTMNQVEKGTSLETQLDICRKTCEMKNYEIVGEFSDGGVSGTVPAKKRKKFGEFLEQADKGKFDVLVFYCFDRLAREIRVFLSIIDELRKNGIKIVSCKENVDTTTDSGDFMMNIYAAVSNLELRTIRTRLLVGKMQKIMATGYAGGRIPYGYKVINKTVMIDKEKGKIVKKIHEFHKKGVSLTKIAEILTVNKIPPPRNGKQWYSKGVGIIIKNKEKYSGCLMNDNKSKIMWPKIL